MSYLSSVSPTVNVQVALPTYFVSVTIYDEGTGDFVAGNIIVDGTRYSGVTTKAFNLEEGIHSFNVEPPAGFDFVKWEVQLISTGQIISEPTTRPLPWPVTEDYRIFAALRSSLIPTSLTISAPSSVEPSAPINFTGRLTVTDTGAGIGGLTVTLEFPPGTGVMTGVTDGNGNYSISVTAPTEQGTYSYRTSVAGTAGLAGAQSKVMGIGVGEPSALPLLALLGIAAFTLLKK